jgi:hypothetical protein
VSVAAQVASHVESLGWYCSEATAFLPLFGCQGILTSIRGGAIELLALRSPILRIDFERSCNSL